MEFPAVTYAAASVSYAPFCFEAESDSSSSLTDGLAAFLLRVAAYFQGYLSAFPRLMPQSDGRGESPLGPFDPHAPLTLIDTALDGTSGPLMRVRMNRALSRRLRWLIRRGRVQRSGRLRVYNAKAEARCYLTPGQMAEYCIRAYGESRVSAYGLGRPYCAPDLGGVLSVGRAPACPALLTPD